MVFGADKGTFHSETASQTTVLNTQCHNVLHWLAALGCRFPETDCRVTAPQVLSVYNTTFASSYSLCRSHARLGDLVGHATDIRPPGTSTVTA